MALTGVLPELALVEVLLELVLIVTTMLVTATLVIVGPRSTVTMLREVRWRLEACLLPFVALGVVLLLRLLTTDALQWFSLQVLEYNITPYLFEAERRLFETNPVAVLQSFQSDALTSTFVFIYIYGYAFLLLFPFVAYLALDEMDDVSALILAFTVNYAVGLACYTLFIAYGPRNFDPRLFEGLLYNAFPQSRMLTNQINQNTNVFPSLHTSLSITVFFLSWVTREKYPLWVPISGTLAVGVVLSTMYLGIHWFSDVVAGTALALLSVYVGHNYTVEGIVESIRRFFGARLDGTGKSGEG